MKIQHGNECIKSETEENTNLQQVDLEFSIFTNYFRKLLNFLEGYFQTCIN